MKIFNIRIGLVILLVLSICISGCLIWMTPFLKKDKDHDAPITSGSSGVTETAKIQTTVSEFKSALQSNDVDSAVAKLTGYDEQTAKNFYSNPDNTSLINALTTALQNATIIKQYEKYAVLEANDQQIGKFKIIMLKIDGEWKISGY